MVPGNWLIHAAWTSRRQLESNTTLEWLDSTLAKKAASRNLSLDDGGDR